jgi:hypothetical protein
VAELVSLTPNLRRGDYFVKQKSQSNADFLGVLTIPRDVVAGCCIRTTILGRFRNKTPFLPKRFRDRVAKNRQPGETTDR